ncbi:MAG TPA: two-component regulator propeller domain-containing protein [Blastocatellia bacterium]|nr:two-component regulator propeller domain-containing protein [Blastocatellia bacterium]
MSTRISRDHFRAVVAALLLSLLIAMGQLFLHKAGAQVEGATVNGVVRDDRGMPVADVKVTITSEGFSQSTLTSADGKFEFRNLAPRQYTITAEATRFRKERISLPITRPDENPTPEIKLTPSSLHVAVLDAANQPLGSVVVTLSSQDRPPARTTTDESGDAYFGRLAPGSYQLTAVLRGYDEYRNEVFISSGITTEFPLQLLVAPIIPINAKAVVRVSVPNLPSKNVQAVFQDSSGWMWFGTDKGVARYNGSEFRSSAVAGSAYEQIAGEEVRSIAEDHSGVIWLATPRGIRRITKDGADAGLALSGRDARSVITDSRGDVWVATSSGVFKFDGTDFALFDQSRGLQSNDARALAEDKSGRIWVATSNGFATIEGQAATPLEQTNRAIDLTDAQSVFVDWGGTVWLATAKGAFFFDGARVNIPSPIATARADSTGAGASTIRAISQDRSGRIWLAMQAGGALLYDPARSESQRIAAVERDRVAAIFTSREGITWCGTDNGAVRADFYSFVNFSTSRGLPDNDVRMVVEEPAGAGGASAVRLWFVTAAGVSRMLDERFVPVERFRASIGGRAVAFDRAGAAWFATDQGVLRLSGQTLTQFNEGNGLSSKNVHWVASIANNSAMLFATARGVDIYKDDRLKSLEQLSGYDVRHAFEDRDGRLWFATSRGIVAFDPQSGSADLIDSARGLADNDARWITRYDDRLLVATRAGIQVYAEASPAASKFTTFDGEPTSTLYVDRAGRYLWTGTDDGRAKKFVLFGGHIISTVYSGEAQALTGSRINSISEDGEGRIWIATDKGAVRHVPVRAAAVVETSLQVDGQSSVPASEVHEISYGRHRLSFRFAAVTMSGQVIYLYRLLSDGADARWQLLPVQPVAEREVSLLDLSEGTHRFEIVALNRDLYGIEAPAAALSLRVGSPFWKRWWFYAVAVALVGFTIGTVVRARRVREREYVLPKELRNYVPIEPNPYIVGNPIRTEQMFYGREDDFRYVRTKLEGVSQGVVIVFCGDRRVGKSSILYQVLNGRLGDRFIPVFVDMQEMVIASDSEFFARVSRLIAEAVARAGVAKAGQAAHAHTTGAAAASAGAARLELSLPQFDGRNPYPVFLDFLDEVIAAIGDRTLLILMDEYELMEGKVDEGKLSPELFTFLAGLMDNKERLALIFTGSRRLEERDKKYWRELLRRSLFRKVGFLSEKDAHRLITEPVEGRVVYGRGVIDAVCRLTAGQPFYTQVICQNLVDYMNEHERNWVTVAHLGEVIADVVDNPLPQMIYTWDVLSDDEKLSLSLLADILPDGNAYATAGELRASVKANDYPVHLSENSIRLTLEEMFRRELLDKNSSDGFRFKIDLLRLWIRRSHSIWQVVKEVRTL